MKWSKPSSAQGWKKRKADDQKKAQYRETILCDKEIQEARLEENMPDCVVRSSLCNVTSQNESQHPRNDDCVEDTAESPCASGSQMRNDTKKNTQASQLSSPKNGRKPVKKKNWQKVEVDAVEKHMMHFIESCRVPGKAACDLCLKSEPEALKQRD